MQKLLDIFFDDLRITVTVIIVIGLLIAFFGAIEPITDKIVQDENTKENIENIESISINSLYLLIAISGIGTVLALIGWFTGFFEDFLDMIRI